MIFKPRGILPAMITPLTRDEKINEKALRKLVRFLIDGGVHGIFAIGTTGEFYGLTLDEYKEILGITMDETAGSVPVYAGANAVTTRDSIRFTKAAADAGVSAVSVLTPYFISINQNEVFNHFEAVAGCTDIPVILYDNKPKTHVSIAPATAEKLADISNIAGIKDSTGDFTNTMEILNRTKGKAFDVMLGRDSFIHAGLCHGASGAVAACANVAPRLVSDIYDKFMAGDIQGSLEAQNRLLPLRVAFSLGSFPTVIKESLELLGIEAGPSYAPVGIMSAEEKAQLKQVLMEMDILK